MRLKPLDWKRGIGLGIFTGVIWGWIVVGINTLSGAFPFENGLLYSLITFSIGGAVFGIVIGGFMVVMEGRLPFKWPFPNAVFLSTSLWVVLSLTGLMLSFVKPGRYHHVTAQTIQGLGLAVILGALLGLMWNRSVGRRGIRP